MKLRLLALLLLAGAGAASQAQAHTIQIDDTSDTFVITVDGTVVTVDPNDPYKTNIPNVTNYIPYVGDGYYGRLFIWESDDLTAYASDNKDVIFIDNLLGTVVYTQLYGSGLDESSDYLSDEFSMHGRGSFDVYFYSGDGYTTPMLQYPSYILPSALSGPEKGGWQDVGYTVTLDQAGAITVLDTFQVMSAVPEPSTVAMWGLGVLMVVARRHRAHRG